MASPILDLSYRNYDGPLEPPLHRWWAIAKMSMRLAIKKKGFWLWAAVSGYWYMILLIIFYFIDLSSPVSALTGQGNPIFSNIIWKNQFLNAFAVSQLFLFILALLLGAGAIANDNRANALLVYLSKPCSKLDYVIGKWVGIFVPITLVSAAPTFVFYLYCLMSYRNYGFLTQDPWLIVRLFGVVLIPGFFHASVTLGISSLFQQGRLAGATYAGLYFFGYFFTLAMQGIYAIGSNNQMRGVSSGPPKLVQDLYYCGIDGIQTAIAKIILHTNGSPLFPSPAQPGQNSGVVPEPSALIFFPAFFLVCGLFMLLAWSKIRAVEVVG